MLVIKHFLPNTANIAWATTSSKQPFLFSDQYNKNEAVYSGHLK